MPRDLSAPFTLVDDEGHEHIYTSIPLPAGKGWDVLTRLVRLAAKGLGKAIAGINPANVAQKVGELASLLDGDLDMAALGDGFERTVDAIMADPALVRDLLSGLARDGVRVSEGFDDAYAANYGELMQAMLCAVRKNYGPFFKRVLGKSGLAAKLAAKAPIRSSSPATQAT